MLRFSNSGEIDLRLITTLGVNVKEGNSSIGYFGTGLKYAIAGVLRAGGTVTIQAGLSEFSFACEATMIRGKEFQFIRMNDTPLGFTTELGKNWQPWMWYREFASNTLDEGGTVAVVSRRVDGVAGETNIYVTGLDDEHARRDEVFLSGDVVFSHEGFAEVHKGAPTGQNMIYYRGIRVTVPDKPAAFRYNITAPTTLTEDRTLMYPWDAKAKISRMASEITDEGLLRTLLLAPKDTFESDLDFEWSNDNPVLDEVIERLMKTHLAELNASAIKRVRVKSSKAKPEPAPMSPHEVAMLAAATEFLSDKLSIHITVPVHVTESLGQGVHGVAWEREIYLARPAFEQGVDWLAVVLIEEWCHAERRLGDFTRDFQTWLLNKIVSTARAVVVASEE